MKVINVATLEDIKMMTILKENKNIEIFLNITIQYDITMVVVVLLVVSLLFLYRLFFQ